ncbi:tRNA (adenosine(37)-N6)-threonylcarbamoyltransferase complex ATPase subunit type 1 TsaE, partial [Desulfovibrio litoralis]
MDTFGCPFVFWGFCKIINRKNKLSGSVDCDKFPIILLNGTLGMGKTTVFMAIVLSSLKKEAVDFSSPSFNLYNIYPTVFLGFCKIINRKNKPSGSVDCDNLPIILLNGTLGVGKTTVFRAIVLSSLKKEAVDFSSPSFNLCNIYLTVFLGLS